MMSREKSMRGKLRGRRRRKEKKRRGVREYVVV
jgi:hypothetical protein